MSERAYRSDDRPQPPANDNALVPLERPRFPWKADYDEYAEVGVKPATWKALVEAVWPGAKLPGVELALSYCLARKLDPFKRTVHIVPVWSTAAGKMVETVWPGIAELRTTAMRTDTWVGCDEMEEGPNIEAILGGFKITFPEWARLTVWRRDNRGRRQRFVGPKVYWLETYATEKRDTQKPNSMWAKRPRGQLYKCAEAAALRQAFPEELGNEYAIEEITVATRDAGTAAGPPRALHAGFSEKPVLEASGNRHEATDAEFEEAVEPVVAVANDNDANPPANDNLDVMAWAAELNRVLADHTDVDALRETWTLHKDALKAEAPGMWKELNRAVAERAAQIGKEAAA